jgi:hypothetical protein
LSHQTTDGCGFVDEDNIPARLRQIHGGPDAADTPADHEYFFVGWHWFFIVHDKN